MKTTKDGKLLYIYLSKYAVFMETILYIRLGKVNFKNQVDL